MILIYGFLTLSLMLSAIATENRPLILSDYIKQNRLTEAKSLSEVKGLLNAPKIKSYSGFLTVDPKYNSNLFFWFFPSLKNPGKAPVLVWLEGGPGVSSLFTLFEINGPFKVNEHMNVSLNPYCLSQEFSVIYVDNPVGTGFSFTDNEKGYSINQEQVADNLYKFLKQFYQIFSEYRDNELYITGESYGGKYVPALGYKLMQMSNESHINFKGIAIGNGLTDPINQLDGFVYLKSTGLIDEKQQNELVKLENKVKEYYKKKDYQKASEYYKSLYFTVKETSFATNATGYSIFYNLLTSSWSIGTAFLNYLELKETRKALNVANVKYWFTNYTVSQKLSSNDMILSVMENMTSLIPKYKVMLFVGNLDMVVGPAQNNKMLENKAWKYYEDFYSAKRVIWKVSKNDPEVAGYTKGFGNFIQVIVRNAGHAVGADQPRSNLDLMRRFVYNLPFETNN